MSYTYCGPCMKCGKHGTAPCSDLDCPGLAADKLFRRKLMEEVDVIWRKDNHHRQPMGCICPPTSEQTCMNPLCPRKPIGKAK